MLTLVLILMAVGAVGFIVWKATKSTAPNTTHTDTSGHGPNTPSPIPDNRPKPPRDPFDKNNPY